MRFHQASNTTRSKIANEVNKGASNIYYKTLSQIAVSKLMAENITRSLTNNVPKVISCEINKSQRLHNDVMLELMLTQKIIKETDLSYRYFPGYLQHLQMDPLDSSSIQRRDLPF